MDEKNNFKFDIIFAICWIVIYILLFNGAALLSDVIGIPNLLTVVVGLLMCFFMVLILYKHKRLDYYGLNSLKNLNHLRLLLYVPMLIIASVNLWQGFHINDSATQIILISLSMIFVGILEELIFRSFLMKALLHKGPAIAIAISTLIFGLFHALNLIFGADLVPTLLQVAYSMAFGFMCCVFFYKTKNIIPCIICHALGNIFDIFLPQNTSLTFQYIGCAVMIIISIGYGIYLLLAKNLVNTNNILEQISADELQQNGD